MSYEGPESGFQELLETYKMKGGVVREEAKGAAHPKVAEVSLVHPVTNAIVKLRDNGMIDIFADANNGIRIDPNTHTLNLFSNGIKEQGGFKSSWLEYCKEEVKGTWTVKAGEIKIHAAGELSLTSDKHIKLKAPIIDLN